MTTTISDFYVGTTHAFSLLLKINAVAQDVSGDTVTLRIKESITDSDADAKVTVTADVATRGADGYADFIIPASATKDLTAKRYQMDVEWVTAAGKEYIPLKQTIQLLERVSDVPT